MNTQCKRVFLAIDFTPSFKAKVFREIQNLPIHYINFIPPENLHLTLRWFGSLKQKQLATLKEKLAPLSEEKQFEMSLYGLKFFEKNRRSPVLWIDINEGYEKVKRLRDKVDSLLNIEKEQEVRKFTPHITISRLKSRKFDNKPFKRIINQNSSLPFGKTITTELTLFESIAVPEGRAYTPIIKIPLQ
ncbi:MAG: RNA 2',3'-cyclic phosphodiesterase [Nitrospinae bacterium]|nr:RNA 2',3'-cyclic phosphodiesterase [Nitrospinota bacterium]